MDLKEEALKYHAKHQGKIATQVLTPIKNRADLTLAYTPGVAEVSKVLVEDPDKAYKYSIKAHTIAVITDGSAVLGLGNIGALGALPVMEGKCAIFKSFAGIDAFPICLDTQDKDEIIKAVRQIAPVFGGINLEDIGAPKCFDIENALQDLGIPVMHDDQHGTAVVVLAGLINAAKVAGKEMKSLKVVISGAGAAGTACANLLDGLVDDIIVIDSKGIISKRRNDLDSYKKKLLKFTNSKNISGSLLDALIGADVFVGVSAPNILKAGDIEKMNQKAIVFAMANPTPEIMPDEAKKGGAFITGTGRSDFPNQINNSLAFPGIFKGALQSRAKKITKEMELAAAYALANLVKNPTVDKIIPGPFDKGIVEDVSKAVKSTAN
ncbi:MAG TPA: NADP-dependent malic enzyme [Patescibacteria group bacterium]|nr:NADP-dependent malic enzyme [Patescibacteria group bacterium]